MKLSRFSTHRDAEAGAHTVSTIKSHAMSIVLFLFRCCYAMTIVLLALFITQGQRLKATSLYHACDNYYCTITSLHYDDNQPSDVSTFKTMSQDKPVYNAATSERFVHQKDQPIMTFDAHMSVEGINLTTLDLRTPNGVLRNNRVNNVRPTGPFTADGRPLPCFFENLETWDNGIQINDVVCQSVVPPGPTRVIADPFYLPPGLERQYQFWLVVYSLLSTQDFAIHSRVHPGLIFEVVNASATTANHFSPGAEGSSAISARLLHYNDLLKQMQELANHHRKFVGPEMLRIAHAMSHIKSKDKYADAADALRVQRGQREFLLQGLSESSRYMYWIDKEFVAAGIPTTLTSLAFVESSFNVEAVSKAGASGVFQIMPGVAKSYDLLVTDDIDERNDPIKAANVAAQLLKNYYERTHSWPLAITAYNHGITSVLSAMRQLESGDIVYIIDNYEKSSFGFASKNYYTCFLAMLSVMQNRDLYFPEIPSMLPIGFETVQLKKKMSLREVKKLYQFDKDYMTYLNPDINASRLDKGVTLPQNYRLKVPNNRMLQIVSLNHGADNLN